MSKFYTVVGALWGASFSLLAPAADLVRCEGKVAASDLETTRILASSLTEKLKPIDDPTFYNSYSNQRDAYYLNQIPASSRKDLSLETLERDITPHCQKTDYAPYASDQVSSADREAFLLRKLDRPLYFTTVDSQIASRGDDAWEMLCTAWVLQRGNLSDDSRISANFALRVLALPHVGESVLDWMVGLFNTRVDGRAVLTAALRHPRMNAYIANSITIDAFRSNMSGADKADLANTLLASPIFAREHRFLTVALVINSKPMPEHERNELLRRLALSRPQSVAPLFLADALLHSSSAGQDYTAEYSNLARDLSPKEQADLLETFLYSQATISNGPAEVDRLARAPGVGPAYFIDLAMDSISKGAYLPKAQALTILREQVARGALNADQRSRLVGDLWTDYAPDETIELLQLLEPWISRDTESFPAYLNGARKWMGQHPQYAPVVMALFRATPTKLLADPSVKSTYEGVLEDIKDLNFQLQSAAEYLRRGDGSPNFLEDIAENALHDHQHPHFAFAQEILRQPQVSAQTVAHIATWVQGGFARRKNDPLRNALLDAIEKHPLATEEVRQTARDTRRGGWGAALD